MAQKERIRFRPAFRRFPFRCLERQKKPRRHCQRRKQEPQGIVGRAAEDPDQGIRQEQ